MHCLISTNQGFAFGDFRTKRGGNVDSPPPDQRVGGQSVELGFVGLFLVV